MVRRNNGRYRLDHTITKKQKTILSAFGLDADDIQSLALRIENMLASNQSLLTTEEQEDETYGEDPFDGFDRKSRQNRS